ncbi:MAG TPA: LysR family transcriptional regulator [Paucimonas sp.]|nr:LysR family transcriptional regulator [Paucimonas sp.]HJW53701.1 LysR family transcriptional regulator [Burkholderiaceae bacterium]
MRNSDAVHSLTLRETSCNTGFDIDYDVIDCGGYADAANALHLSQFTVSCTISRLQEQLSVALLRIEGRKAILTPEGRILLERLRHMLKGAIELETFAQNLGRGWGEEVQLVFNQNFPTGILMQALNKFAMLGNGIAHVHLCEVAMLKADDVLRDLNVGLAISDSVPLGFFGEPLLEIESIPVAHPEHPLMLLGRNGNETEQMFADEFAHPRHRNQLLCNQPDPGNPTFADQ